MFTFPPYRRHALLACTTLLSLAVFSANIPASDYGPRDRNVWYQDRHNGAPPPATLTLERAIQATAAAWESCRANGYSVSVAIVDRAGVLLSLVRDPNAGPHTVGSGQGKAFTSASTGQVSGNLAQLIAENAALAGLRDMDPRMVILAGGLPILMDGQRVGGIGVGGAPGGHLDEACAQAGLKRIGLQP